MATTKITSPDLFDLGSLDSALQLPSGTTAERPTSPSTGEWRFNTDNNLIEFYDGVRWRDLQDEDLPAVPSENFNTVLYTGTGVSGLSITGVGFQPDIVWIKCRDLVREHNLADSNRGVNKEITPDSSQAEENRSVTSFDSDGFTLDNLSGNYNAAGASYVAWCWKLKGGTNTTNTEGSITTTVQANTQNGTSVMLYTGTGANATIGHGLSSAPELVIVKKRSNVQNWMVGADGIGWTKYLELNQTNGSATASTPWNNTAPSATTVSLGSSNNGNQSGETYVMYAFHSSAGYSKIGSYTGTGAAGNGQVTGFEPAWVMIKRTDSAGAWSIYDNKRNTSNPRNLKLVANSTAVENVAGTTYQLNFLTNGFEFLGGGSDLNASGGTFIYIAFAADPSAAPVLANSFDTTLYTGNSSTQSITGLGFSPNLVWIKVRNNTYVHGLYDTIRGPLYRLRSNGTEANENVPNSLTSFDSDGFTLGSDIGQNQSANNYVAWAWKANSIPTINTDGTVQSVVSANQASGFSIVEFSTSSPASTDTIGHGLSAAPELILTKTTSAVTDWYCWHTGIGTSNYLILNSTSAKIANSNLFNSVTSTNFQYRPSATAQDYIAYCFHSVPGFSKFGTYTGTGSSGLTVTTGFQVNFLMLKGIDSSSDNWFIFDSARGNGAGLHPNLANAEFNNTNAYSITFNSTSFTLNFGGTTTQLNTNGNNYIYMAFKENYSLPETQMAYLSVAGGGGASRDGGGGGGAGGLRTSWGTTSGGGSSQESDITLAAGTYTITVGSGGNITNGTTSSIAGPSLTTISCVGGGVGSGADNSYSAGNGGSGGGGAGGFYSNSGGSETANEGFAGGSSAPANTGLTCFPGAGGGGASAAGASVSRNDNTNGGDGGAGLSVDITGTGVFYAGGGGGAINACAGATPGSGGSGVGGTGSVGGGTSNATDGATNSGGGAGGGSGVGTQGLGGSGVVILRLKTSVYSGTTTGSPTVTTDGSDTILTYTGSGTYVHS